MLQAAFALCGSLFKRIEQHVGIGNFEMISAHLPFVFAEYVAIGDGGAVGGRVVIHKVENAVLVLDIHRQTFQTISQLA